MAKKIRLYAPGITPDGIEFDEDHANAILALEKNGGWTTEAPKKLKLKRKDAANDDGLEKSSNGAEE